MCAVQVVVCFAKVWPASSTDPALNAAGSVYLTRPLRTHFNRTYDEFA
jgi:NADPH2:quinone reductase